MLRGLGRTQGTTKTQIVLSALRSVFEENFLEKKSILLPEDQYQALVELVGSPLTPQEIEGRKKLKKKSPTGICEAALPAAAFALSNHFRVADFLAGLQNFPRTAFFQSSGVVGGMSE